MFRDRIDAAQQLVQHLQKYQGEDAVILSIPRGGVPIGDHIAKALDLPLDIVPIKKIGHPLHKELAIGAVSMDSRIIDNYYDIPQSYIEEETEYISLLTPPDFRSVSQFYEKYEQVSDKEVVALLE